MLASFYVITTELMRYGVSCCCTLASCGRCTTCTRQWLPVHGYRACLPVHAYPYMPTRASLPVLGSPCMPPRTYFGVSSFHNQYHWPRGHTPGCCQDCAFTCVLGIHNTRRTVSVAIIVFGGFGFSLPVCLQACGGAFYVDLEARQERVNA